MCTQAQHSFGRVVAFDNLYGQPPVWRRRFARCMSIARMHVVVVATSTARASRCIRHSLSAGCTNSYMTFLRVPNER